MNSSHGRAPMGTERIDWLRLFRTENVGPVTFKTLLAQFGSAAAAIDALPELARRGGRDRPLRVPTRSAAEKELDAAGAIGASMMTLADPDYPRPLRQLDDAPPVLFIRGHAHLLSKPAVAVVGSRDASLNAQLLAREWSMKLGRAGFVVVSGLALGVDAAAHAGALQTGTVACMAGGIDILYPDRNAQLAREIAARGALIAESPFGQEPSARHFPRRNRIIAGLSLGVLVVEARVRSGSLITARLAGEAGREVFAVPGSPLDQRSHGSNALIRDGALLVQSPEELIAALRDLPVDRMEEPEMTRFAAGSLGLPDTRELEKARAEILTLLSPSPTVVDEIVRYGQFSAAVVLTVLLELELAGRVERQPGNRVSLVMSGLTAPDAK